MHVAALAWGRRRKGGEGVEREEKGGEGRAGVRKNVSNGKKNKASGVML